MHKCPQCNQIYSLESSEQIKLIEMKYKEHCIWNHPAKSDVIDLYHDITIKWRKIQNFYHANDYINASLLLSEVSTDALRFKKYIDMEL